MLNLSLIQNHSLSTEKWNKYFALGTKAMTTVLLFFTLLLFGTLSGQTIKQSKLVCTSDKSCTSKDLEVVSVAIDAPACATCKAGDIVTFPLKMTIHNGTGSVRTSFSLYGTLSSGATINGLSGNIFICVGAITVTKGDQTFLNVGTITYKCGDPLTLTNNYLAWTDAAGNTTDRCDTYSNATTCADIAPKCGTAASITIQGPIAATATPTAVKCKGDATGSIDLTPSGGKPPYTFLWSNGATTEDISGLTAATYSVTITDANKCTFNISAEVKEPAAALTATATPTAVKCKGDATGSIDLTPSGGTSPYTFLWSNGATTEDISGLKAGTYSVTITDANKCTFSTSAEVKEPAAALSGSAAPTAVKCKGDATGSIDLTPSGGTTPYTFLWSNGATTEDISSLTAGTYSVTITDANKCTFKTSAEVKEPAAALSGSVTPTDVKCKGDATGSIDLTPSGGTAPYTFLWSNGATTEDISGLTAGTYSVTITDANKCTFNTSAEVKEPAAALSGSATPTNVTCKGGATGSIDLTPSGGTAPYTFLWSNGATTEDISGLTAGTYSVTITDANKCTFSTKATVADGSTPAAPTVCIVQPSLCDATMTGFKISFTSQVADGNQYSIDDGKTWFNTSVFCNVAPGSNPIMRVKNAAGCVSDPTTCTSSNVSICKDNPTCPTLQSATTQSTIQPSVIAQPIELNPQPTVKAAPNPYNDKVRFSVKSAVSGQGTLDLYNMLGQKVKTVFQGHVEAGQIQSVEYNVPNAQRANLIYIFRVGDQKVTGKLLH